MLPTTNRLLLGDNLCLLQTLPGASVNLAYLDPPFLSNRTYTGTAGSFDDHFPSMAAYIAWMRPRIVELHRVLKPYGSLYLHCDDSANAYLNWLLADVFGPGQYRDSIIWRRTLGGHNDANKWGRVHDTILFYAKTCRSVWNAPYDAAGCPLSNLWDDVKPLNAQSKERVGWPTQKPVTLLERIVAASSNPGHVVLDPFCGAGTTLVAAQHLGRKWIGMDQSPQAVAVTARRLENVCGLVGGRDYAKEGTGTK